MPEPMKFEGPVTSYHRQVNQLTNVKQREIIMQLY